MTFTVLVLCTGNIGRSPLAEAIFRRRLADGLHVSEHELTGRGIRVISAGTHAPSGWKPSPRGVVAASTWDVDMSAHQSTRVSAELIAVADHVFCMDGEQVSEMKRHYPSSIDKIELLDPAGTGIPDPRGQDDSFFSMVRDRISAAIEARLPGLLDEARGGMGTPSGR